MLRSLIMAMIAGFAVCTWDGATKTQDCNKCACSTSTVQTIHAPANALGRCSSCGKPL